ncbi:MAG: AgmX/PglI C-terminal domain-containing protein [Myxococcota bacterium]
MPFLAVACLLAWACQFRTRAEYQRDELEELLPKPFLKPPELPPAPIHQLKLRVWAGSEYRAHEPRWADRFTEVVREANLFTRAWFGVELEVTGLAEWNHASAGATEAAALEALRAHDFGVGVDFVVGLVGPLPHRTRGFVGFASGRHFLLRTTIIPGEVRDWREYLDTVPRDQMYEALGRRTVRHEVVALLHEWGHALGLPHDTDSQCVMHPENSTERLKFCDASYRQIMVSLLRTGAQREKQEREEALGRRVIADAEAWLDGGMRALGNADAGCGTTSLDGGFLLDGGSGLGSLPREAIRQAIRDRIEQVRVCFEAERLRDPDAEGKVVVTFVIGCSGQVQSVSSTSKSQDGGTLAFASCIEAQMAQVVFPSPSGGGRVVVTYPFVFKSR